MADTDAFVPDAEFVGKNMFYLVLAIGFFILIGFMVRSLINNKARNYGPLKKSYTTQLVSDVIKHRPVKNIHLDCPRDPHKYSFTFFLKINANNRVKTTPNGEKINGKNLLSKYVFKGLSKYILMK